MRSKKQKESACRKADNSAISVIYLHFLDFVRKGAFRRLPTYIATSYELWKNISYMWPGKKEAFFFGWYTSILVCMYLRTKYKLDFQSLTPRNSLLCEVKTVKPDMETLVVTLPSKYFHYTLTFIICWSETMVCDKRE